MVHGIKSGQVCGFSSETIPRVGRRGAHLPAMPATGPERKKSRMHSVNFTTHGFMSQVLAAAHESTIRNIKVVSSESAGVAS